MDKTRKMVQASCTKKNATILGIVCLVAVITASFLLQGPAVAETQDRAIASVIETGKAFTAVTKEVSPAVVFIKATKQVVRTGNVQGFGGLQGQIPDEMLKRFFGDAMPPMRGPRQGQAQPMVGQGSGFIISRDGYILTNNHVAGDADKLEVTLHDGRVFEAHLVGTDKHTDVAIIKIDQDDLPTLKMGDSDKIEVGQWVLAVGSPFGLTGTVTSGIVSAKGRNSMGITDYENFIQTDAAINPGNSGGPLVNMQGEAIGINTAIMSRSGGYNGIGFAIPMNMAKSVCEQLIEHGSVTRGFMGVMIQPLTPDLATSFKLKGTDGVLIGDVTADGPAAAAGLQRGDVVVKLDGEPVKDLTSFRNRVAMIKPGSKAKLEVMRNGKRKTIAVTIGKLANDAMASDTTTGETVPSAVKSLGLNVQAIDEQLAAKLGVSAGSGVVITQVAPGSEAAAHGLQPGMVIKEVDHKRVSNPHEFADVVKANKDANSVLLLVQRGEYTQYLVLKLSK